MSLLDHSGATATVTSKTKCLILELPVATFREVIMTHPHVLEFVGELAAKREREMNQNQGGPAPLFEDLSLDLL